MLEMSHGPPREITARRDERHGSKLGDIIRRLSFDNEGKIVAAVIVMRRMLKSCGADIHALADHVEKANGGLSDTDKQKIRAEIENARAIGYAEGVKATEAKRHGTGTFRNIDGKLEWNEVALLVQRKKHRLPCEALRVY
jgi:hypothetical protein